MRNGSRVLFNGELEQEHAEMVQSLKPENHPYFDNYVRLETHDRFLLEKGRKDAPGKLGYVIWLPRDQSN